MMLRFVALAVLLPALAACGVDGPPERPVAAVGGAGEIVGQKASG